MKIRILASILTLVISGSSYASSTSYGAKDNGISESSTTEIPEWKNVCRAGIHSFVSTQRVVNPYEFAGKCYLYNFDEATIGSAHIQWLGPNKLLEIITAYNDSPLTILYQSDEPIDLSKTFLAVGAQPEQYQDTLGAIRTPVTFRILTQGVTDEISRYFEETQKSEAAREERDRRKNLRPPAYLTSPDSKNFVDQCRFVKLGFDTAEEANEAGPGEVRATCLFSLGDDNYWRVKGCHLVPEKGTSQEVMDASKRYLSSVCWAKDDFHTELDKNGVGTKILTFSLGDE